MPPVFDGDTSCMSDAAAADIDDAVIVMIANNFLNDNILLLFLFMILVSFAAAVCQLRALFISAAAPDEVVVDKSAALQECVAHCGAEEFETAAFHIFAYCI